MRMTNIAVPFIALVALVAADRVFHPHPPRAARLLCGPAARPLPPTVDQVVDNLAAACSAPDGVEVCGPPVFAATFAYELPVIGANRGELEHRWIERLGAGDRDAT